jgi:hypothetical protein
LSTHSTQKVHSYEQIRASDEAGGKSMSQHSQFGRSSSAIVITLPFEGLSPDFLLRMKYISFRLSRNRSNLFCSRRRTMSSCFDNRNRLLYKRPMPYLGCRDIWRRAPADRDPEFLRHARAKASGNVEFQLGNAYGSDLPSGAFNLMHMRFVASTAGSLHGFSRNLYVSCGSAVSSLCRSQTGRHSIAIPPHPAWDRLKYAFLAAFRRVGADLELGRQLYYLLHQAGLRDLQYRTALLGVRSVDPMIDYLPSTVESLQGSIYSSSVF